MYILMKDKKKSRGKKESKGKTGDVVEMQFRGETAALYESSAS